MPLDYTTPSPELMRELLEVAAKAEALRDFLKSPNIPLDGFPSEQLKEMCVALARLPKGTAEGCRESLVYARKRLPAIRREHVAPPAAHRASNDADAPPPVSRGEGLDLLLKDLLASVTTALDQYQVEARVELPDAVEQETAVDTAGLDSLAEAVEKSRALDPALAEAIEASAELVKKGVAAAEALERQFTDAETQNQMARTEAQMPTVRLNWYQPLVAQFMKMPERIEATGRAMQTGADWIRAGYDTAKPLRDALRNGRRKVFGLALELMTDAGVALEQFGQELTARRDGPPVSAPATKPPDCDLDKVREMILAGIAPPKAWVPWIEELIFAESELEHLNAMEGLTELKILDLNATSVINIAQFQSLSALRELYLSSTRVADISPLKSLKNLQILVLLHTQIADIGPLKDIVTLRELDLGDTFVADIRPLERLIALEELYLDNTPVSDLSPLGRLRHLRTLELSGTMVANVDGLEALVTLRDLHLDATGVVDISPLAKLTGLKLLSLFATRVANLAPLKGLNALERLDISRTQITDLSPLRGLAQLQAIYVESKERAAALEKSFGRTGVMVVS